MFGLSFAQLNKVPLKSKATNILFVVLMCEKNWKLKQYLTV